MATVETLLNEVRYTIGDERKTKYTDARLLTLYNEGMRDIVKQTKVLRDSITLLVENGITTYALPDDVYFLTRAIQEGTDEPIVFKTYSEMDQEIPGWENDERGSVVEALIYNEQNLNEITIYPKLNGIDGTYFKLADGTSVILDSGTEGAITYLADTSTEYTSVVTQNAGNYGALVSIDYDWFNVKINYVRKPVVATAISDAVDLPDIYFPAVKYYIAGVALLDDSNNEGVQKGTLLLQKYTTEIGIMKSKSSSNYHRVDRPTNYRTPFN